VAPRIARRWLEARATILSGPAAEQFAKNPGATEARCGCRNSLGPGRNRSFAALFLLEDGKDSREGAPEDARRSSPILGLDMAQPMRRKTARADGRAAVRDGEIVGDASASAFDRQLLIA